MWVREGVVQGGTGNSNSEKSAFAYTVIELFQISESRIHTHRGFRTGGKFCARKDAPRPSLVLVVDWQSGCVASEKRLRQGGEILSEQCARNSGTARAPGPARYGRPAPAPAAADHDHAHEALPRLARRADGLSRSRGPCSPQPRVLHHFYFLASGCIQATCQ